MKKNQSTNTGQGLIEETSEDEEEQRFKGAYCYDF